MSTEAFDSKLSMSRSFGDFFLKQNLDLPHDQQAVIAVPDVRVVARSKRCVLRLFLNSAVPSLSFSSIDISVLFVVATAALMVSLHD